MVMSFFALISSLFFILNPLGNIPLFVSLLAPFDEARQRKIIVRELLIALFILLLFNFFGDNIMNLLGISQSVLGVAGGTLLFLLAIGMIFPKPQDTYLETKSEPMIVPLAIPLIAGPGSLATVMIYSEQIQNVWISSLLIIGAWIPVFILLILSSNIKRLLGDKGLVACQRLGGMLISLIAVQMICSGLVALLQGALNIQSS